MDDRRPLAWICAPWQGFGGRTAAEYAVMTVHVARQLQARGFAPICMHPAVVAGAWGDDGGDPAWREARCASACALAGSVGQLGGVFVMVTDWSGGVTEDMLAEKTAFVYAGGTRYITMGSAMAGDNGWKTATLPVGERMLRDELLTCANAVAPQAPWVWEVGVWRVNGWRGYADGWGATVYRDRFDAEGVVRLRVDAGSAQDWSARLRPDAPPAELGREGERLRRRIERYVRDRASSVNPNVVARVEGARGALVGLWPAVSNNVNAGG